MWLEIVEMKVSIVVRSTGNGIRLVDSFVLWFWFDMYIKLLCEFLASIECVVATNWLELVHEANFPLHIEPTASKDFISH